MMVLAGSGCLYPDYGCGDGQEQPLTLVEVHEWGVFQQHYGYNDTFMAGGGNSEHPPKPEVVETEDCKPVIYFHGRGIGNVNVTVRTNATDIVTIPQAQVSDGVINWQVTVTGELHPRANLPPPAVVWDNQEENTSYEYLFYEGKNKDTQDVVAKLTKEGDNLSFNLTNIGQDSLGDMLFFYLQPSGEGDLTVLANWTKLEPGENRKLNTSMGAGFTSASLRGLLKDKLLARGLVEKEAEDLLEYWMDKVVDDLGLQADRSFTEQGKNETAHILYFMPQSKLDARLPMTVDPSAAITRVGLMWVQDVPVGVVE